MVEGLSFQSKVGSLAGFLFSLLVTCNGKKSSGQETRFSDLRFAILKYLNKVRNRIKLLFLPDVAKRLSFLISLFIIRIVADYKFGQKYVHNLKTKCHTLKHMTIFEFELVENIILLNEIRAVKKIERNQNNYSNIDDYYTDWSEKMELKFTARQKWLDEIKIFHKNLSL